MKKIFIQFWQGILKHRKRLIYGALAFFVGQICFLGIGGIGNSVFAEGSDQTLEEKMEEKLNTWKNGLSFIVKMVYILIYPLLVLAGKLVDNSFVYGEVIGFDAVLWQLWNMVRNLANFTLGFIFIYKIFEFLIKGQKIGDIKKLLISSLIAGIGIQASWFLMAALIDVSTILTYSVGGLPISILEETAGGNAEDKLYKYNPYVLKTVLDVDAKNIDDMHLYFTNSSGSFYISECKTFIYELSGEKEELILAPEMIYYKANSGDYKPTDAYRCHYNGQIYYFENLYEGIENADNFPGLDTEGNGRFRDCSPDCGAQQNKYKALLEIAPGDMKEKNVDVETLIVGGGVLEIGDAHMTGGILRSLFNVDVYSQDQKRGLDVGNEWTGTGGNATRLQDILDGKSYVGVFSALYSSLIASGRTTISQFSNASSYFLDVLNAAFSVLYVLAISIPLMVVAIVFLMRIGVLWLAISFSPFIVLLTAFDLFKSESIKKIKLLEYLSLENLIPIIFSPAIICFAISISTVLFIIITEKNTELGEIDGNLMLGLFSVKIADGPVKLSQLVVAVLGVAITWFIVWAAIETSKLGKSSVVQGLKSFVTGELGAMPIVPIPGKDGKVSYMGLGTVFGRDGQGGILSNINNKIKNKYEGESNEAIDALLDPEKAAKDAEAKNLKAYKAGLTSRSIDENWMKAQVMIGEKKDTPKTFNDFEESEQESIIEEINGLGKARLEGIPIDNEVILKSGKIYKFVAQRQRMKDNKPVKDADGKTVMDDVYKYEKVDEGQKSS